jgi:hypothetical protein
MNTCTPRSHRLPPERRIGAAAFLLMILFVAPAYAQQDASIVGVVRDSSGGILPGVSVTARSPALQVPQMLAVTDERGEYRLTPLPIGTYEVTYELTGFQPIRRAGLRLTSDFTARVDVVMNIGGVQESITVSGASPVVDATATSTSTRLTAEMLETTPTGRVGFFALLQQAPGVRNTIDIGGNSANANALTFRSFGQSGEAWQSLEGILTASAKTGQSGNYFDYASVEEARVQTVGADASMPLRGVMMDVIVKSGSNEFHSANWWQYTNSKFQSSNLDEALRSQGISEPADLRARWTGSADLGGRIIQDKLWFYVGATRNVNNQTVLGVSKPDGTPADDDKTSDWYNMKISYQPAAEHRFVGFQQYQHKVAVRDVTQFVPWESRTGQTLDGVTAKGEWQGVWSTSLVTSVTAGLWQWHSPFTCPGTTAVATFDLVTQMRSGCGTGMATGSEDPLERNVPAKAMATLYRPDLFLGNHEFKAGVDFVHSLISRRRAARPVEGDYQLNFRSGVPFQIVTYNFPVEPLTNTDYLGLYAMDSWRIARRLTLNVGLRFAHDAGYVPEQCREAGSFAPAECYNRIDFPVWNSVAPRLHASFDLLGTGRTVLKAGWARFDHRRLIDPEVLGANRNVQTATTYTWRDLDGDRQWDLGEANLDPDGPDFVSRSGFQNLVPNADERQPKQDEFMASFEHELRANFGVRLTGIHSIARNDFRSQSTFRPREAYNIPITNRDPGEDGRLGTADDPGTFITYYEYSPLLQGARFTESRLVNSDTNSTFTSIDLALTRRFADNWMMQAAFSGTSKNNQNVAVLPQDNPNADFNQADQNFEWISKLSGSYRFPYDIQASALFELRSGEPWARTVLFSGGTTIPTLVVNVEPIGARSYPNVHHLDVRAEKAFRLSSHELAIRFNVYNVLNSNMTLTANTRSGATFGRPLTILPPRLAEFSASYKF